MIPVSMKNLFKDKSYQPANRKTSKAYFSNKEENIMKRFLYIILTLVVAISFSGGCATMEKISMPKITGGSGESDSGLYRKVPASMRADVKEAEFDLKRANANALQADEKLTLSEMKKEREILRNKYAKYNKNLSEVLVRKANIKVEIKKMEAIDNSNLGDRAGNIKNIANLKTKKLGIESDEIEIKADMDMTDLRIKQLNKLIIAQGKKIKK
jgi:hypothetical protein